MIFRKKGQRRRAQNNKLRYVRWACSNPGASAEFLLESNKPQAKG